LQIPADEFFSNIVKFDELTLVIQTDLLAFYLLTHSGAKEITASPISSLREALHLSVHGRLAQYLSEQAKKRGNKKVKYVKTEKGYVLERGYSKSLQSEYLGRTAAKNITASLHGTLSAVSDPIIKSYLEEAIACFEQNLLRSALIMTWCVAYGLLRAWIFRNHLLALNEELAARRTPVRIQKLDDFQELTESSMLDTAKKISILSKEHHKTLKQLLDQRNSYAHPTAKAITPSMTEAYIETVLKDVIPNFG